MIGILKKAGTLITAHKYICTILLFLLIGGFIGKNSVYHSWQLARTNDALREEIAEYDRRIASYRQQQQMLDSNPAAVEEIARVRLLMKKADEDIYVVETLSEDSVQ